MRHWQYFQSDKTTLQLTFIFLLGAIVLLINGCSSPVNIMGSPQQLEKQSILPVEDSKELPAVIRNLMDLADKQYFESRVSDAVATLERAIRIKPRYPEIWSRMAYIYAQLGQPSQASQYAQRSNSYINNNQLLKQFNDELIQPSQRSSY